MFMMAAMIVAGFANAQTIVNWCVMDSTMGSIDVIHPVVHYDTVVVYDTVGDAVDTISNVDTVYNDNQWFLVAVPADGVLFTYWINEWFNSDTNVCDTVYSDFNLIDVTDCGYDSVMATAYFMEPNSITEAHMENIKAYPNPTTGIVRFSKPIDEFYVYDECGRPIISGLNAKFVDLTGFNSGIYFIKTKNGILKIVKR